jgi:hypothetical protein
VVMTMIYDLWCVICDICSMTTFILHMVYDTLCLTYGSWCMIHNLWLWCAVYDISIYKYVW